MTATHDAATTRLGTDKTLPEVSAVDASVLEL
jgi:hypothetical protein